MLEDIFLGYMSDIFRCTSGSGERNRLQKGIEGFQERFLLQRNSCGGH